MTVSEKIQGATNVRPKSLEGWTVEILSGVYAGYFGDVEHVLQGMAMVKLHNGASTPVMVGRLRPLHP